MPTLTLKFKENILGDFSIAKGRSLTIGRKAGNDIAIENLAVSGHHARIDATEEGCLLTDLQSKNGSFVNKQRITSHWLRHGDTIVIGKHTLVFAFAEGEAGQTAGAGEEGPAAPLTIPTPSPPAATEAEAEEETPRNMAVLTYLSGGQGDVALDKKFTKIGKNPASDIVVGGLMMGQTAMTISQGPNGYTLNHVEGMTRPKVNGKAVKLSILLQDEDQIEMGPVKFRFFLKQML